MSKTNLIEDELDLLIDSVLEAAPPDLKARCVKDDILVALRETCGIYNRDTLRTMLDYDYGVVAPLNSTVRSRKDDLPSEVTELGSVVN